MDDTGEPKHINKGRMIGIASVGCAVSAYIRDGRSELPPRVVYPRLSTLS